MVAPLVIGDSRGFERVNDGTLQLRVSAGPQQFGLVWKFRIVGMNIGFVETLHESQVTVGAT